MGKHLHTRLLCCNFAERMKQKDDEKKKKGVRERKPNYKEYRASVDDIQTFLLGKIMLRHNVITRRVEYCFPSDSIGVSAEWQPIISLAIQLVGAGITQKLSTVMLGRAFVEQGFERKTYRNTRGYVVVRRSAEEMRSLRSMMAVAGENTDTDDTDVF